MNSVWLEKFPRSPRELEVFSRPAHIFSVLSTAYARVQSR